MSTAPHTTIPRLKSRYRAQIVPALREEFAYDNIMQVPGLVKIVVNMGVGEAARDSKLIEGAIRDLAAITGQKPQVTKARKSIAQFKLREGMPIGAHVTLRGDRMWEFLDRLLTLALPRIRDFRGLSANQFDGRGNYTFGLTEQVMFHEIDQDKISVEFENSGSVSMLEVNVELPSGGLTVPPRPKPAKRRAAPRTRKRSTAIPKGAAAESA